MNSHFGCNFVISVMCHSFSSVSVTIGFNQTTYSVREDAGSVTVSVSVISGTISQDVIITLSTAPGGTATGGIVVLRSAAASIPKHELPCFLNQDTVATILFVLVQHLIKQIQYPLNPLTTNDDSSCY